MISLISIIIPTYNRAHLIGETLDSVISQTYQNWECIVVDDGSTDDTAEVMAAYCEKDARFCYYHRPDAHKPGGNGARNYGFLMSKGEYVQWFDSDDIMLPEFLEDKIYMLQDSLDLVITTGFECNEKLGERSKVSLKIEKDLFTDYALWRLKIFTPSVLFRRSFLQNKQLFNENLYRGQETEFFCRIFFDLNDEQFLLNDVPLFLYRRHKDTKSSQNTAYIKEFKQSQAFIAIENIKRSLQMQNNLILKQSVKSLFKIFFLAQTHKDKKTMVFIKKKYERILRIYSFRHFMEFKLLSNFLLISEKGKYWIKNRWIQKNHYLTIL